MTFISLVSMIINIKGKCILAFVTSLKPKALFIYIFLFVVPKHGEYHFTVWMECVTFLYGHFTFHLLLLQVSVTENMITFLHAYILCLIVQQELISAQGEKKNVLLRSSSFKSIQAFMIFI